MAEVRVAHTAELDAATLREVRALLDLAFADDPLDEHDWEHCQGGLHVLAAAGGSLVGHAAVVQRRLLHGGRALRAGYVEGVGVHPDHRRRGHGAAVMDAVERIVRGAYDLGALGSTDLAEPFYLRRGWRAWPGPLSALTPGGVRPTPEEADGILVLATDAVPLAWDAELTCDWRDGAVW
jgi:aminoglycoside 2'-N-acetyltransferase I